MCGRNHEINHSNVCVHRSDCEKPHGETVIHNGRKKRCVLLAETNKQENHGEKSLGVTTL